MKLKDWLLKKYRPETDTERDRPTGVQAAPPSTVRSS